MNPRFYLDQANTFLNSNNYKAAIEMYTRVIEQIQDRTTNEYATTLIQRGKAYQLLIETTKSIPIYVVIDICKTAINDFATAIEIDPTLLDAKDRLFATERSLMRLYYDCREYNKVIELCKRFIQNNPKHPNIDNWNCYIANSYFYQKDYQTAIGYLNAAIISNEKSSHLYYNLGRVYKKLDNFDQTLKNFMKAIEIDNAMIDVLKSEKKYIFNGIISLPKEQKISLLKLYIDPTTPLGMLAHASRNKYKKAADTRGTLKHAHAILEKEAYNDALPTYKHTLPKANTLKLGFIKPPKKKINTIESASELKLLTP